MKFDDQREFQNRRTEDIHAPIHAVDVPKLDENEDSEVVEFIDKYITCALPDEKNYPEISNLVKKLGTPWALSDKTRIVCSKEKIDETIVKQSKNLIDKVLFYIVKISDQSDVTLSEMLEKCGVT